jgi:hypothetical protein
VVNAKCDTHSPIIVPFPPPRDANAMDPHNQPKRKRQYAPEKCESRCANRWLLGIARGPATLQARASRSRCKLIYAI